VAVGLSSLGGCDDVVMMTKLVVVLVFDFVSSTPDQLRERFT